MVEQTDFSMPEMVQMLWPFTLFALTYQGCCCSYSILHYCQQCNFVSSLLEWCVMSKFFETFLYLIQYSPSLCNSEHYFVEQVAMAITTRDSLASFGHCKALAYPCLTSLGLLVSYTNSAIISHNATSISMLLLLYLSTVQT